MSNCRRIFSVPGRRWLGVQVSGQEEQPRVLLLSVPYALKWPQHVPALMATDHLRSWIVMKDEGSPLREGADPRLQIGVLNRLLPLYGEMQLASRNSVDELIRMGLPDRCLRLLPELVEHLVSTDALGYGRTVQNAERLKHSVRQLLPSLMRCCTILTESPYALALDHGDLHTANILVNGDHACLCDWGNACVTHPFCSIGVTIESALRSIPEADRQKTNAKILASYLEPWTALASPATLQSEIQMALWVAHVLRALDFARMFRGEDEESRNRWKTLIGEKLYEWISLPIPPPGQVS